MPDDEGKIFIDEDWKAQVRREKEQAQMKAEETAEEAAETDEALDEQEADGMPGGPEATFDALVASLTTQTMLALGLIAPEGQEQVLIDLDSAKFTIDMLVMLREKTKGNLEPKESSILTQAIGEMQQVYLARVQQYQQHAMQQAGIDPSKLRGE